MGLKESLKKTTEENQVTIEDWDNFFTQRCERAAKNGRNYEVFGIYEKFRGESIGEDRLYDFAKRNNLTAARNRIVYSGGSTVVISW